MEHGMKKVEGGVGRYLALCACLGPGVGGIVSGSLSSIDRQWEFCLVL